MTRAMLLANVVEMAERPPRVSLGNLGRVALIVNICMPVGCAYN